jgi:hypothetical protein
MKRWAQAFFHREWNTWCVGYYSDAHFAAEAYTPTQTEAQANAEVERYNRQYEKSNQ